MIAVPNSLCTLPIFEVSVVDTGSPEEYVKVSICLSPPTEPAHAYVRRETAIELAEAIIRELKATPEERIRVAMAGQR